MTNFSYVIRHEEGRVAPLESNNIIKAALVAEEGCPPFMTMTIPYQPEDTAPPQDNSLLEFFDSEGLLFSGRIVRVQTDREKMLLALTAIAQQESRSEDFASLKPIVEQSEHWDQRFYGEQVQVSDLLNGTLHLPYWSRESGAFQLSGLFEGRKNLAIDAAQVIGGYTRTRTHQPLAGVKLVLHAKWTQSQQGQIDLTEALRASLPDGDIRTLTPDTVVGVLNALPMSIKDSGYYAIRSGCEETDAYVHERQFFCKEKDMNDVKAVPAFVYVMKPDLLIGWDVEVQREEVLHCQLSHKFQGMHVKAPWKTLHLEYTPLSSQAEPQPWCSRQRYLLGEYIIADGEIYGCLHEHISTESWAMDAVHWKSVTKEAYEKVKMQRENFFVTDEGKRALSHALAKARGYLAFSARCEKIKLHLPLRWGRNLDCDTTLVLRDDHLSATPIRGKVSAYRMTLDAESKNGLVEVEMMSSIGAERDVAPARESIYGFENLEYAQDGCCEIPEIARITSLTRWEGPDPYTANELSRNILQGVEVMNAAAQQCEILARYEYPVQDNPFPLLAKNPTIITMKIKKVPKKGWVKNSYTAELATPWTAPQQMILGR